MAMETAKLGKKGQVSIPKAILDELGLDAGTTFIVETMSDGGIVLRPAGVYPIELYSDDRIEEFGAEDQLTEQEAVRLRARRA